LFKIVFLNNYKNFIFKYAEFFNETKCDRNYQENSQTSEKLTKDEISTHHPIKSLKTRMVSRGKESP
jgi:hypothetical protein